MNERIKRLRERLRVDHFQICVEKAALVVESLRDTEGEPEILRRARATANFLDNKTVFIEDDDPYVDNIAGELFEFWADTAYTFKTVWGGTVKPTGISITAHAPGGAMTCATPDGRCAGQTLADGTLSPAQGMDVNGPTAVLRSAMTIDQTPYQATLLNMKFDPSALKTEADLRKLSILVRTYFKKGGKHVQFNVVNREMLLEGQREPEKHRDLIVRVAGYSAYFVNLVKPVQDEIICRTEYGSVA